MAPIGTGGAQQVWAAIAKEAAVTVVAGKPGDEETRIGPVVSEAQYDRIQRLIEKGIGESNLTVTIEGRRRFPVRVRYAQHYRSSAAARSSRRVSR